MVSLRRRLILLATCVVAVSVLLVLAVTAFEPRLDDTLSVAAPNEVVGAVHVHTDASDGGGTLTQVLEAANGLGLDFLILTDHNVRGAPAWAYEDSVLLIVGEEVNTPYGHILVIGEKPIGDRRRVGENSVDSTPSVRADEGLRIVAHPTGRPRWTAWEGDHFDGIEIWNADTERRNDRFGEWLVAVALVPLRPLAGLFHLLDYPGEALGRWDRLQRERPVFGVCSVDAHHTLPLNRRRTVDLHFPAYRHSFRMARQHVLLDSPLSGDPSEDGASILSAMRDGRSFCAFDGLADGRGARFTVESGEESIGIGGSAPWRQGAEIHVSLPPHGPEATTVRLIRDGDLVMEAPGPSPSIPLPGPGVYRIEVLVERNGAAPWILTNPFRLTRTDP